MNLLLILGFGLIIWLFYSTIKSNNESKRNQKTAQEELNRLHQRVNNFHEKYGQLTEDDFINLNTTTSSDGTKISYAIWKLNDKYSSQLSILKTQTQYIQDLESQRKEKEKEINKKKKEEYEEMLRRESDPFSNFPIKIKENSWNWDFCGVYMIYQRELNLFYIGSSRKFSKRIKQHLGLLRSNSHHSYKLQRHFNEYGENSFEYYMIESIDIPDEISNKSEQEIDKWLKFKLLDLEQSYIRKYKPFYNVDSDVYSHYKSKSSYY